MTFDDMPESVRTLLREQFEREMRKEFETTIPDQLDCFLAEPEIDQQWQRFRETLWHQQIDSPYADEAWHEWLAEHEITP